MSFEDALPDGISIERDELSGHLPANQTIHANYNIGVTCPVCDTETIQYSFCRLPISHNPETVERFGGCRNCKRFIHVEYLIPGDNGSGGE